MLLQKAPKQTGEKYLNSRVWVSYFSLVLMLVLWFLWPVAFPVLRASDVLCRCHLVNTYGSFTKSS